MVYLGLGLAIKTGDFLTGAKRREWMGCWGCTSKSTSSQKKHDLAAKYGCSSTVLGRIGVPKLGGNTHGLEPSFTRTRSVR